MGANASRVPPVTLAKCGDLANHHDCAGQSVIAGPGEQHEDDGGDCGTGEDAEDHVKRHLPVAQHAEAPVGKSAAAYAHEVHDPVAGSAELRPNDL